MHRSQRGTRPPRIERVAAPVAGRAGRIESCPRGVGGIGARGARLSEAPRPPAALEGQQAEGLKGSLDRISAHNEATPFDVRTRVARAGQSLTESRAASRQQTFRRRTTLLSDGAVNFPFRFSSVCRLD